MAQATSAVSRKPCRWRTRVRVLSVEFVRMVLCAVQDANDDDVLADDTEKDFVGKSVGEDAAKATVINREAFGIGLETQ